MLPSCRFVTRVARNGVPATAVPSSRLPASITVPARALPLLVITGTSFVPLIVTVTVWST